MKLLPQITTYAVVEEVGHNPDGAIQTQCCQFEVNPKGLILIPGTDTWFTKENAKKYFDFCKRAVDMLPVVVALLILCGCESPSNRAARKAIEGLEPSLAELQTQANDLTAEIKAQIVPPMPPAMDAQAQSMALFHRPPTGFYITTKSTGAYLTNQPGYVYFVSTNQPTWITNGPLPVYPVTEFHFYGDAPHQFARSLNGPWDRPANNQFVHRFSTPPAFLRTNKALFFRGHVTVTNYSATLPVPEVSYLETNL